MLSIHRAAISLLGLALPLHWLAAQGPPVVPGSDADERARVAEDLGVRSLDGAATRSASAYLPAGRAALFAPELRLLSNTGLPFSLDQGSLWGGVGVNALVRIGGLLRTGRFTFVLAPEFTYSQNRPFTGPDSATWPEPAGRSRYASPFHPPPISTDLPWRFGARALYQLWWGQSSVSFTTGLVAFGVTTEDEWWGPGIRNALVLSNNAPGIPRLFVRTARPLRTPIGSLEARWFVGGMSGSGYFDSAATGDLRSLAALALVWRPRWEPDLIVGFTRAVYREAGGWAGIPLRFFDVFRATARADTGIAGANAGPRAEGMTGFFARWVFPSVGAEAYVEWARNELPHSLRDLLTSPGHGQAYTLGLQWTRPDGPRRWRLQAELTNLEKDPSYADQPTLAWYVSRAVPQGYTNRGRVVGAGIGPGGSGVWLAVDVLAPAWRAGGFLSWIRWEDDSRAELPNAPAAYKQWCGPHDLSLTAGVRGGVSGNFGALSASAGATKRLNPFFPPNTYCATIYVNSNMPSTRIVTLELRYAPPWP